MDLYNMTVCEYLEHLKAKEPAPGGGAAAALTGAQGMALMMMAAEYTLGNKKYADWQQEAASVLETCASGLSRIAGLIDADKQAYLDLTAARRLSADTDEQKAEKAEHVRSAAAAAIRVPLDIMRLSCDGMRTLHTAVGHTNPYLLSDLGVALVHFDAAVHSGWINVLVNLPSVESMEERAAYRLEAKEYIAECETLKCEYYDKIMGELAVDASI